MTKTILALLLSALASQAATNYTWVSTNPVFPPIITNGTMMATNITVTNRLESLSERLTKMGWRRFDILGRKVWIEPED
jgi:hypothetical protein